MWMIPKTAPTAAHNSASGALNGFFGAFGMPAHSSQHPNASNASNPWAASMGTTPARADGGESRQLAHQRQLAFWGTLPSRWQLVPTSPTAAVGAAHAGKGGGGASVGDAHLEKHRQRRHHQHDAALASASKRHKSRMALSSHYLPLSPPVSSFPSSPSPLKMPWSHRPSPLSSPAPPSSPFPPFPPHPALAAEATTQMRRKGHGSAKVVVHGTAPADYLLPAAQGSSGYGAKGGGGTREGGEGGGGTAEVAGGGALAARPVKGRFDASVVVVDLCSDSE